MAAKNSIKNDKVQEPAQPQVVVQDEKLTGILNRVKQQSGKGLKTALSAADLDMIAYQPHISRFKIADEIRQGAEDNGFVLCWVDDDPQSLGEYEARDWLFCTRDRCGDWIPDGYFDENGLVSIRGRQSHYLHFQSKALNEQVKQQQSDRWELSKQRNKDKVENDDRFVKELSSNNIDPVSLNHDGDVIGSKDANGNEISLETDYSDLSIEE